MKENKTKTCQRKQMKYAHIMKKDKNKKLNSKTISMSFFNLFPEHLESFKDGRQILVKLKNGEWDLVTYIDGVFQSIDIETVWSSNDIEIWAFLPND